MQIHRRGLLAGGSAAALFCAKNAWAGLPAGTETGGWRPLKLGTGGLITGIDIAPDGTRVCRTDSFGAYIWSARQNEWVQLLTSDRLPVGTFAIGDGIEEIKIDPSNSSNIWMLWRGKLFKSINRGETFAATGYPTQNTFANSGAHRTCGPYIAIDPNNPNVVYVSTTSSGLWVTTDGGGTFSQVAAVSTATIVNGAGGGHRVCFDLSNSTTIVGGQTRTASIFVHTYGRDTWKSSNGGQSWASTSPVNKPTHIVRMVCDPFGVLWVVDDIINTTNCCKFDGNTWTVLTLSGGETNYTSVAIDVPNSPDKAHTHVCFVAGDRQIVSFSTNGGATWSHSGGASKRSFVSPANDVQWLHDYYAHHTGATFFANCDSVFDPLTGRLYTGSEGVWFLVPSGSGAPLILTQESRGIEEFISTQIMCPSSGVVLVSAWDYPIFRATNFSSYPSEISGPLGRTQLTSSEIGYSMDYQWDNPLNIGCIVQDSSGQNSPVKEGSGFSIDGGQTWAKFANVPSAGYKESGGTIAITSGNTAVWLPSHNQGIPKITNDYTSNPIIWKDINILGGTPTQGWGIGYYYATSTRPMDSDKGNGDIYIYNVNRNGSFGTGDAIYKYSRATRLWSFQSSPNFSSMFFWEQLKCVPGQSGHSFISAGNLQTLPHPQNNPFFYTTDGWISAPKTVVGFLEVSAFGFGARFPGQSYPTIFTAGWYTGMPLINGVRTSVTNHFGVYMCKNFNIRTGTGTWILCGDALPGKMLTYPNGIDGDKATPGQVYAIGTGGSFWGRFN